MTHMKWKRVQQVRSEVCKRRNPDLLPRLTGSGDCWCGGEFNHDWPGKKDGEPHPR